MNRIKTAVYPPCGPWADKEVRSAYGKVYYQYNKEKKDKQNIEWLARNETRRKEIANDAYARNRKKLIDLMNGKCKCCGEKDLIYLQIDHVNNDGHVDRNKGSSNVTLRRYMQTPERFQLLCANCNHAKRMNGGVLYKPKKRR